MTASSRGNTVRAMAFLLALLILLALVPTGCGSPAPPPVTKSSSTSPATPGDGPRFSFIVCADPQNNYDVLSRVLQAARSVDFLIIAGDLTGSGTKTEFENLKNVLDSSGVKYYCVPGNHDVATTPVDGNYTAFMGQPFQSFDYKNSHFILLDNSDWRPPRQGFYPAEQQWAASDLALARKKKPAHIFAVCHVPPGYPYSSSPSIDDEVAVENNERLAPVLKKGGAEELFCGHWHAYKQEEYEGLKVVITGGAGAEPFVSPQNGGYYHYVLVEVNGDEVRRNVIRI